MQRSRVVRSSDTREPLYPCGFKVSVGADSAADDLQGSCSSGTRHWIIMILICGHAVKLLTKYLQRTYCAPGVVLGDSTTFYVVLRTVAGGQYYFSTLYQGSWDYEMLNMVTLQLFLVGFWDYLERSLGLWKKRKYISLWYLANNVSQQLSAWWLSSWHELIFPFFCVCLFSRELCTHSHFWVLVCFPVSFRI